jgi:hypothetical protein
VPAVLQRDLEKIGCSGDVILIIGNGRLRRFADQRLGGEVKDAVDLKAAQCSPQR